MRLPLVIGGIPIIPIDFSEPPLIIAMRALSLLGTIPVIFTATLALAFVLFWRRRRKALVLLLLIVCGGEVIGLLLKWLFAEPFLPWTNPLLIYSKASFPSGHAMRSVLFFGCLTYFLMRRFSSWRGRLSALFAGTGLVLSIGASRVYLGAHDMNEVLAGYSAGIVWLLFIVVGVANLQRNQRNHGISWRRAGVNRIRGGLLPLGLTIFMVIPVILIALYVASPYATGPREMRMLAAPYPPSPVIERMDWDFNSLKRAARGSDIWALTWGDDGNLYTSWGDGGGFGGSNYIGRVSMGVGRIEDGPENWRGFNVWGGANPESPETPFLGKAAGMLSLDGVLYMSVSKQDVWTVGKIARSTDHGRTWSSGDWDFKSPLPQPKFLNFGKNYEGARDEFVYAYGEDGSKNNRKNIILMRVPKNKLASPEGYEFFSGLDSSNKPIWTDRVENRKPVFTDPNGVGWGVRAVYNKGIHRYLLTIFHGGADGDGSWGIFDAPEPWGPWTTVAYYTNWIDGKPKFSFDFPVKWISSDGQTLWMVFSGTGIYDSFNIIKGKLILRKR